MPEVSETFLVGMAQPWACAALPHRSLEKHRRVQDPSMAQHGRESPAAGRGKVLKGFFLNIRLGSKYTSSEKRCMVPAQSLPSSQLLKSYKVLKPSYKTRKQRFNFVIRNSEVIIQRLQSYNLKLQSQLKL